MKVKIPIEEKRRLKGQGFICQNDGEHFACRVLTKDGCLNTEESQKVSEIAEKYGRGYISFTVRLSVEIPWIQHENIENVKKELGEANLVVGGTGPRVRTVVACKGTVCPSGRLDTQGLAREIHERFYEGYYDVVLPNKFKIGVGGCPNKCIKPDLNDFCIVGHKMAGDDKKEGLKIFLGGTGGKQVKCGEELNGLYTKEEALEILEKSILYYKENGNPKERFGDMITRIGLDKVSKNLIG